MNYHDKDVVNLLQFEWPIEHDETIPLEMGASTTKVQQLTKQQ